MRDENEVVGGGEKCRRKIEEKERKWEFWEEWGKSRELDEEDIDILKKFILMKRMDKREKKSLRIERMEEIDKIWILREKRGEFLIDDWLKKKERGRSEELKIKRIDNEEGGIEREIKIGIGKEEKRVFEEKIKMKEIKSIRKMINDERECEDLEKKEDGIDVGMIGKGIERILKEEIEEVK